jgi:hypothetical protein
MPGRAADLPFQRLVRAVGETCAGDSTERVAAALKIVDSLLALKAPALVASPMLTLLKEQKSRFAPAYLAHEYMGQHWDPLFVTEVRSEMAEIGLKPVGSATLVENHDSFVLGHAAREALAVIGDEDVRELARDFLIDQFFRRDLFVRRAKRWMTRQRQRLPLPPARARSRQDRICAAHGGGPPQFRQRSRARDHRRACGRTMPARRYCRT